MGFAFCAYLVELGICERVTINTLLVGHTHIDLDQRFSVFGHSIRHLGAMTLGELRYAITMAYQRKPGFSGDLATDSRNAVVTLHDEVHNWTELLEGKLSGELNRLFLRKENTGNPVHEYIFMKHNGITTGYYAHRAQNDVYSPRSHQPGESIIVGLTAEGKVVSEADPERVQHVEARVISVMPGAERELPHMTTPPREAARVVRARGSPRRRGRRRQRARERQPRDRAGLRVAARRQAEAHVRGVLGRAPGDAQGGLDCPRR